MTQREPEAISLLEERCLCGSLLAKVSRNGVEILCRRCKRIHRIPWQEERREGSAELRTRMAANR